jgi:hypothetical protein
VRTKDSETVAKESQQNVIVDEREINLEPHRLPFIYPTREARQNHRNGLMHVPACMYNKLRCGGEGKMLREVT